ncbi:spermatogenesis-associated serine-rich protein 2 isoform X2 [Caloenas nicobarica]|uniref:spermatogenesis-associated serine-rich protein 2 isoform X2 n=1 Tax=Caloenas nicobarica TaxID=187106 RepID=UPI0032B752E0
MSKKQNTKDPSGFIFDVQSNTVMAQGGTFENMKEKISAVRAIVPNWSNNEIVLVLQHFDNCVDRTVQAFMEGNASEVLKEWTVTGKKKNKKKKTKVKMQAEPSSGSDPTKLAPTEEERPAHSERAGINGFHINGCAHDAESADSLSEGLDALSIDARELEDCDMPERTVPDLANGIADSDPKSLTIHPSQSPSSLRQQRNPPRPPSRSVTAPQPGARLEDAPVSPANKKLGSNIEKSVKDLQRCSVSLARYRAVLKEEMDASIKKMKQVFAELQSSLMDREVALLAEMDKVKAEAMEILVGRQRKAEALKKLTDVAVRMSDEQLVELRADIKHFVSERKYDEELGRVARFSCDLEALKRSIAAFGHGDKETWSRTQIPTSHSPPWPPHPAPAPRTGPPGTPPLGATPAQTSRQVLSPPSPSWGGHMDTFTLRPLCHLGFFSLSSSNPVLLTRGGDPPPHHLLPFSPPKKSPLSGKKKKKKKICWLKIQPEHLFGVTIPEKGPFLHTVVLGGFCVGESFFQNIFIFFGVSLLSKSVFFTPRLIFLLH